MLNKPDVKGKALPVKLLITAILAGTVLTAASSLAQEGTSGQNQERIVRHGNFGAQLPSRVFRAEVAMESTIFACSKCFR